MIISFVAMTVLLVGAVAACVKALEHAGESKGFTYVAIAFLLAALMKLIVEVSA